MNTTTGHVATVTAVPGHGFRVTCPWGCPLGTSADQETAEGAARRVAFHKEATTPWHNRPGLAGLVTLRDVDEAMARQHGILAPIVGCGHDTAPGAWRDCPLFCLAHIRGICHTWFVVMLSDWRFAAVDWCDEGPSGALGASVTEFPTYAAALDHAATDAAGEDRENRGEPQPADTGGVIAAMIAWLDAHGQDALAAEDPRTWAEVHTAGVVTDNDVIKTWLSRQAPVI